VPGDLYARCDAGENSWQLDEAERKDWRAERIECLFDLASACSRFGIYENSLAVLSVRLVASRDEFLAETAAEEDFDEYNS